MSIINVLIAFPNYIISFSYKEVIAKWHIRMFPFFFKLRYYNGVILVRLRLFPKRVLEGKV